MEREHAVITQMWDYWKQCEDIVIVSKTRKTFLVNIFFPLRLLGGGGSQVPLMFFQFFLFKNHLESLPDC